MGAPAARRHPTRPAGSTSRTSRCATACTPSATATPSCEVREIARALDRAGVASIEVAHGDGLAGSSFNYGFGAFTDWEWLAEAASCWSDAVLATLLLPGIGTAEDLRRAHDLGVRSVRIATHCTEADISAQHIASPASSGWTSPGS
jgi:4-hydroxy 2-oxovalerate aldolase